VVIEPGGMRLFTIFFLSPARQGDDPYFLGLR